MDLKEFIDKSVTSKIAIKELKQRDPEVRIYASASRCINSELGVLYVNSSKLSLDDLDSIMSVYDTDYDEAKLCNDIVYPIIGRTSSLMPGDCIDITDIE